MIAAQVGIAGHIKVGDEVKIGAQSGVMSDVEDKGTVQGSPAIYHKSRMGIILSKLAIKSLDFIMIKDLETIHTCFLHIEKNHVYRLYVKFLLYPPLYIWSNISI